MLWPATIYSVGAQTRHHAEPVKLKHFMAAAKGMLTKYNAKVDSFAKKICSLNQMAGSTNYHKMHLAKSDSTQPFWPSHFGPALCQPSQWKQRTADYAPYPEGPCALRMWIHAAPWNTLRDGRTSLQKSLRSMHTPHPCLQRQQPKDRFRYDPHPIAQVWAPRSGSIIA